jgi:hypothetical protein
MTDEIAKEIVDELRLIREELQNLTMAIRSKVSNSENTYSGKSRKSFQPRSRFALWSHSLLGYSLFIVWHRSKGNFGATQPLFSELCTAPTSV